MDRSLLTEVQFVKGVGPRMAPNFHKLNLHTVQDLLWHLPRKHQDRRNIPPISRAHPGTTATVKGKIRHIETRPIRGGRVILKALLEDKSGAMVLTWFNQPWVKRQLEAVQEKGYEVVAYGLVKENNFTCEMASPEWEAIGDEDDVAEFARIVPIYPLTEGIPQKTMRKAISGALDGYLDLVEEPLPVDFRRDYKLLEIKKSLSQIHSPQSLDAFEDARKRLVFEEFLYMQIELALRRSETHQELGIAFPIDALIAGQEPESPLANSVPSAKTGRKTKKSDPLPTDLFDELDAEKRKHRPLWEQIKEMLPFELTGAQRRVVGEIFADMKSPFPMNRLVQGDVGAGKTAVAACCLLAAVRSGYQTAMMAPTEILAEQHFRGLTKLLEPLGIRVELLVGKLTAKERKAAYARISTGSAQVVVGTHAIIQESVQFSHLGFVVVDEQHRFGVLQRKAIRDKATLDGQPTNPDVLVMTATPIPRTLTMTVYGDLDLSVIDELPPGRKPIKTHFKRPYERQGVYDGVRKLLQEGRQAYFVCPMVSENEKVMAQAAEQLFESLAHEIYPEFKVGLLHGQMKPAEKDEVMIKFRDHDLDILVATTVIEVGVDVPNASVMVIEDANRFGLSQLHQLRGRVGRGQYQSFCILIADAKSEDAQERMDIMVETTDGFKIAEADLRLRGPGNLAGTEQSGSLDFKVADLVRDAVLLEQSRQAAMKIVDSDPKLESKEWSRVKERVYSRRSDLALVTVS